MRHSFECGRGEAFLRVLFQALDDDVNGVLDHAEFQAVDLR